MSIRSVHAFAPGRVNLIGEHTDYNGGLALPFALVRGIAATATVIPSRFVEIHARDLGQRDRFPLADPHRGHGWRAFARGAVMELHSAGVELPGVKLVVGGDLPRGAGVSSSAAFTIAICLALLAAAGVEWEDRLELARLAQRVENRWVGAQTGLLDQIACLFGAEGQAVLIDFRSLELELLPLTLGEHRLVLLNSGQSHGNAASGYNQRREECVEAAHRMGKESLRDAQIQDLHMLPDVLARRARHVISENGRVTQAAGALRTGDMERLGRLLNASHESLRDDFEVSSAPVEAAVARLRDCGATGARLVGGGFGGSVLGLMPPDADVPEEAIDVQPGAAARLIADQDSGGSGG